MNNYWLRVTEFTPEIRQLYREGYTRYLPTNGYTYYWNNMKKRVRRCKQNGDYDELKRVLTRPKAKNLQQLVEDIEQLFRLEITMNRGRVEQVRKEERDPKGVEMS